MSEPTPPTPRISYVTGATGFIGSHLAELLKARGDRVRLFVRSPSRLPRELQDGYEVVEGTLNDPPEKIAEGMEGADYIYHVAGLIAAIRQEQFDRVNIEGTRNIIEGIRISTTSPKRLVLVSSLATIGPSPSPDQPVKEDDEPNPQTMYGRSKLEGERLAWKLTGEYGIDMTVVRPPAVYGPRDTAIFEFFKYMAKGMEVGFGKDKRHLDLIHGRDLSRGIIMAGDCERAVGESYFITDEGKHEFRAVMATLREVMKPSKTRTLITPVWVVRVLSRLNDLRQMITGKVYLPNTDKRAEMLPLSWCCSGAKAREHFGFEAEIPLADGFAETSEWYVKEGWMKIR